MKESRCSECDSRLAKSASIVEVGKCRSCAPAYTIKGLEWEDGSDPHWHYHTAHTLIGRFKISGGQKFKWKFEHSMYRDCDSIEDGKAKAEAHYRHLMESCLEVIGEKE